MFFDLTLNSTPVEGVEFEDDHKMLPIEYEMYGYFSSFGIRPEGPGLFLTNGLSQNVSDQIRTHFDVGCGPTMETRFSSMSGCIPRARMRVL